MRYEIDGSDLEGCCPEDLEQSDLMDLLECFEHNNNNSFDGDDYE